jgi:prevent-host-death family protein
MATAQSKNVKTAAEFARQPLEIMKLARRSKKPVLITLQGKPGVVVMDAAVYENRLKTANLVKLLEEGEQDIRSGRLRPAAQVLKDLARAKKVSR